jgi:hypothetical protein
VIVEALKYVAARLSGQSDRHGHLAEAIALEARHGRQRQAWAGHLEQCRATCLAALDACPPERRRTALVLGAGLLLDVPLEELAKRFSTVVLLDLAFLPRVAARAKALGNVRLLRHDITGCLDELAGPATNHAEVPRVPPVGMPQEVAEPDFVYSANLLSQLPLFALPLLRRHHPHLTESARMNFAAALIQAHLDWLRTRQCPACLVTDMEENSVDRQSTLVIEHELLYGSPLPEADMATAWNWDFGLKGEALVGKDVRRRVVGILDMRPSCNEPEERP